MISAAATTRSFLGGATRRKKTDVASTCLFDDLGVPELLLLLPLNLFFVERRGEWKLMSSSLGFLLDFVVPELLLLRPLNLFCEEGRGE